MSPSFQHTWKLVVCYYLLLLVIQLPSSTPFQPIYRRTHIIAANHRKSNPKNPYHFLLLSKKSSEGAGDNEDDDRAGMNDAFQSLDGLSSLDLGDLKDDTKKADGSDIKTDELLKTVSSAISNSGSTDTSRNSDIGSSSSDEVKLYSEIYEELEKEGEDGIYDNIMGDMIGSTNTDDNGDRVMKDVDGIGSLVQEEDTLTAVEISQDTDELMKRALEEAMDEVKSKAPNPGNSDLAESILDDKEMMKEINAIFDRANEKLLDGIAEIKNEQAALTEASAKSRSNLLKDEEQRLAEAQGSVVRLVDKVKQETVEVEKAMEDLKEAQEELMKDPLMKAADLKSGGIVKQGALVGALLFSFRSFGEVLLLAGPNGVDHGFAAAVQAGIALACAAYFVFV